MGVKWTDEQKQVIDLRGRNLLVSAAAGSGKTAVLVERIIERVVDPVHPVDIDRMLIVTFTRAAAGEMKDRIGAALQKRLEADPANDHLQKQGVLLHHAQISTIHGFCTYVIRNYFHRIDLDPAYRVGEQGELQLLRNRVMKDMLEEEYTRKDAAFVRFMDSYARGRTDERAEKLILGIYDFAMSAPDPDEWLDSCCRSLAVCSDEELSGTAWMQSVMNETRLQIEGAEELYEAALMLANDPQGPADVVDQLTEEQESIYALTECFSYASMAEETGRIKFPTLRFKKNSGASPDIVERVKDLRNAGKKIITNIQASPFCDGTDAVLAQCAAVLPAMEELVRLVKLFRDRFSAAKRDKNLMDFSDLEHFALQILLEKAEDGTWKRTAAAKELAEHFEEIMTDEYQDSNQIQEVLLNAVSRNEDGGSNRFMVGDMKQSIYGFRMARPQLFLDKYDRYPRWNSEGDGDVNGKEHVEANDEVYSEEQGKAHVEAKRNSRDARIDLNFNFRSRREVLDCANALFEKLMIPSLGGILYDDAAALHCRASYPEPVNPDFPRAELILLNKTDPAFGKFNNKDDMTEAEAATVAAKIRAMVGREMVVDKETGEYRPLEYRDCVVLLRSASSLADAFVRVLRDNGIPAFAASREGYFSAVEVVTVLNYLRLIDNPLQDIPYAAVLRSPIGGLNDGELAQLRAGHRDVTLAEAVKLCIGAGEAERGAGSGTDDEAAGRAAVGSESSAAGSGHGEAYSEELAGKLTAFTEQLERFRDMAVYTPVHELIRLILKETGYGLAAAAMPAGEQRSANLAMLIEKAVDYEGTSCHGVFNFIRYIEQMEKYEIDYGEVNVSAESDNTVRVMTIHKSKGLEFPVVFLSGCGNAMNTSDQKSTVVRHVDLGIGLDAVDLDLRVTEKTMQKEALKNAIHRDNLGEELRVLYVALTRAKEKLIMTGVVNLKEDEEIPEPSGDHAPLSYAALTGAKCYLDWILKARPEEKLLKVSFVGPMELAGTSIASATEAADAVARLAATDPHVTVDEATGKILRETREFVYPYQAEASLPAKMTVTELKRRRNQLDIDEREQRGIELYEAVDQSITEEIGAVAEAGNKVSGNAAALDGTADSDAPAPYVPAFMKEQTEEEARGAARGTIYHHVLECLDYKGFPDRNTVAASNRRELQEMIDAELTRQIESMKKRGLLSAKDAACIRSRDFYRFLTDGIGIRMTDAADRGLLRREQPFVIDIPAKRIDRAWPEGENILVQGTIDAYFEENGEYVLVDYKTDRVRTKDGSDLVEKYASQLRYYRYALETITGIRVKEMYIYSIRLGREIPVGV